MRSHLPCILMLLPSVLANIGHQHFACAWARTSGDMMLELMFILGLDQMGLMMLMLLWMISMTITKRTSLHHLEQQPRQAYLSFQTENWVSCPCWLSWAMLRYWLRVLLFYAFDSQMMVLDWMLLCQQRRLQHWQEQPLPPLSQKTQCGLALLSLSDIDAVCYSNDLLLWGLRQHWGQLWRPKK